MAREGMCADVSVAARGLPMQVSRLWPAGRYVSTVLLPLFVCRVTTFSVTHGCAHQPSSARLPGCLETGDPACPKDLLMSSRAVRKLDGHIHNVALHERPRRGA